MSEEIKNTADAINKIVVAKDKTIEILKIELKEAGRLNQEKDEEIKRLKEKERKNYE